MAGRFDRCPKAWLRDEAHREVAWIQDHARYKTSGVLPFTGGWLEQKPCWVEACEVIEAEAARMKEAMKRD